MEESSFKNGTGGWRGDVQWSKPLATLPEDPIAIPSAYIAAHNHQLYILGDFISFFSLQEHQACMWYTYLDAGKAPIHMKRRWGWTKKDELMKKLAVTIHNIYVHSRFFWTQSSMRLRSKKIHSSGNVTASYTYWELRGKGGTLPMWIVYSLLNQTNKGERRREKE